MAATCRTLLANIHPLHSVKIFRVNKYSKRCIRRLVSSQEHSLNQKIDVASSDQAQTIIPKPLSNTVKDEVINFPGERSNIPTNVIKGESGNDSEMGKPSGHDYFKTWIKTVHSEQSSSVPFEQNSQQESPILSSPQISQETSPEQVSQHMSPMHTSLISLEESEIVSPYRDESLTSDILKEIGKEKPIGLPLNAHNLAAYANYSATLQNLVKLGVDVSQFDAKPGIPESLLRMDFDNDIKPYILFMHNLGIPSDQMGNIITKCPLLLQEDLENLQVRVNYFQSKRFGNEAIARIVTKAPRILRFTTQIIDQKLGFYQKEFTLTGNELRETVTRSPELVTYDLAKIKENHLTMVEELGFLKQQAKTILKTRPKILMLSKNAIIERFDFLHHVLLLDHDRLVDFPGALLTRRFIVKQRHLFLQTLGRDQYDPTKENFVSLQALVSGSDKNFCVNVAKTSVLKFNDFQRTL